jgi:hypothetical protein
MQFEVPQFIEIEDKIFGPLTWRQFLYVGGGGMMAAVMFLTMPFIIFVLIGIPLGTLAFALAFFPVNNRPFSDFLASMYSYATRQKVYHWQQSKDIVHKNDPTTDVTNPIYLTHHPTMQKKSVASLSRQLELNALQKK